MTTLDNQISCVQGSDLVARIPKFCYGPSRSQTMLYFANSGVDFVDPDQLTRNEDRGIKDALSDHFMEGYKERLAEFLLHQDNKPSKEDIKELNELADEVENV